MKKNNFIDKSKNILLSKKDIIFIFVSILIVIVFYLLPTPSGLSHDGQVMIGILIMAAVLWITESIPLAVTGLLIMILQKAEERKIQTTLNGCRN